MFNMLLEPVYAIDVIEPYIIWGSVALVGVLILAGLAVYFFKTFRSYVKAAVALFVVYALIAGIVMLVLEIIKHYDPAYLEENYVNADIVPYVFIPTLVTVVLALVSAITMFILAKKRPEKKTTAGIICGALCLVSLIVTLVLVGIFYSRNIVGDGYYTDGYGNLNSVALYVSAAALVVCSIIAAFLISAKDKRPFDTHCIAFAGICVAMSFALSYIKLFEMPQGGSITLASMLPVMLFAYVYGAKKGLLVGFIYGILQAVQDPYIVHPAQFLLDYPIAFSMVGFAGIFANVKALDKAPQVKFALGSVIAGTLRFVAHVFSGVFAFGAYALDEGFTNFWLYSLGYNSFIFIDVLIVAVVGVILFSSTGFRKELGKLSANLSPVLSAPDKTQKDEQPEKKAD